MALQEGRTAEWKAALARACRCDPDRAQIPVMGRILACDGRDKPVERGKNLRARAECDGIKGPAASKREVQRLAGSDPELSTYIATVHVPRCQKP